ncbi:MAG: TIGR00730 family Rossman fold protein [Pseudomonadota bacterium]
MAEIRSVCVFCGSSNSATQVYKDAAQKLGKILGKNDVRLVYGGGQVGLMGTIANSALEADGKVTGFIPQYLHEFEKGHTGITELFIVDTMHERKRLMADHSDAFVILPGGFGTLDEICEILTWKQLRLHYKPIVFVDVDKYWSPLFDTFVQHMIDKNFVHAEHKNFYVIVDDVDQVLPTLKGIPGAGPDFVNKWW